jgi:type I site-specific restriction endonuclease
MSKKFLSESDICAKYITPAVIEAGWDEVLQIRREVSFTKGRIIVRGKLRTQKIRGLTPLFIYLKGLCRKDYSHCRIKKTLDL